MSHFAIDLLDVLASMFLHWLEEDHIKSMHNAKNFHSSALKHFPTSALQKL